MAIIYSYPKATNPLATDVLVLTSTAVRAGKTSNATKSLALSDLASYVISSTSAITGSGTINTIPMFTPTGVKIGDSIITQSDIGIDVISIGGRLNVSGDLTVDGRANFTGLYARFSGQIQDYNNSGGTAGQVLNSTGTGVEWKNNTDDNTTYDLTGQASNTNEFAIGLLGSNGTLDKVNLIPGTNITLTDNGSNGVTIDAAGITGTGTTNTLPIWSDGPNGVLGNSGITQTLNANNKITNITLATNGADPNSLSASFGTGGSCRFSTGDSGEFMRLTSEVDGFYKSRFRFQNKVTVDRDSSSVGPSLDVGDSNHTYAAAWFRNGVVLSNNPSGVTVDNTSMVIGSGNNDVVTGSDNCLAVGNNNQILSDSDNSLAVGQGNVIRNNSDNSFAIGQGNTIDGTGATTSVRSQVLGYQNSLTGSFSSFIAGGQNTVTTNQNAVALGFSHTLGGDDSMFAFGENNTGPSGATDNNSFMIGGNLTGTDGSMALGFRNDTSSYPATDYSNGLGNTKFAVSVGTVTNSNAIVVTEGGVNRGAGVAQVPRIILPQQQTLEFASDTDATAGGIPTGGLYRNGSDLKINFNGTGGNERGTSIVPGQAQGYIISVTNKTVGSPDFNDTELCTNVIYNRQVSSSLNWSEYGKQWTPSFDNGYDSTSSFGSRPDAAFAMLEESVKDVLATTGNSARANSLFAIISYDNLMLASHEMPLAVRVDNNGASPGNGTALIKLVENVNPKTGPPNLPSTTCVWFVDTTDTSSNMGGPIPTIVFAGKDTAYAKLVNGGNQYDAGATYTFTGNTGDNTRKYALLIEDEYYSNMRSKYLKVTGGRVVLENLPTSDPSSNGVVWNDSGTLKISAG